VEHREGQSAQDPFEKIMAPWTFSIKFLYDTQFIFGSFMLVVGVDGNLKLLTQGPAPKQFALVYGQAPYLPGSSSTSGGACIGLNPFARSYHPIAKAAQELQIRTSIFQPLTETSSSSTSRASLDRNSVDDYPKIRGSTCWNPTEEGHLLSCWPRLEHPLKIAQADIPPLRDQKRPMLKHSMID
jgi:hypothetical protein